MCPIIMNEYETICKRNEELISKGWIVAKRSSNYTYSNITLPQKENVLSQIYLLLGREKKSDRRQKLTKLFTTFMSGGDETVEKYCKKQLENLEQNKAVEFFNGDYEELKSVLECCIALKNLPQEMYYRNFSVKQFGDSKKFEILQGKISSLLFKYGNFSEKESVFDELGLLKTPSYIHIKGNRYIVEAIQRGESEAEICISSRREIIPICFRMKWCKNPSLFPK